jgi:hypothetical protein
MTDYQEQEATPVIGPGVIEEVADRLKGNTVVSDIDGGELFLKICEAEGEFGMDKFEARVEGWYNLITQLGEIKANPIFRIDPFNRLGLLYLRIEQYMLLLASPSCTPELKAQYWADVVQAQAKTAEETIRVTLQLTQTEYAVNHFDTTICQPGQTEPAYTVSGDWATCLKRATQFYRVRRWECSSWKAVLTTGTPIQSDQVEGFGVAIATALDEQENEAVLDNP